MIDPIILDEKYKPPIKQSTTIVDLMKHAIRKPPIQNGSRNEVNGQSNNFLLRFA